VRDGMKLNPSASCKSNSLSWQFQANLGSRTYGSDIGEDIREGYEPTDDAAVVAPKDEDNNEFVVGDDEDLTPESEEQRHWKQQLTPDVVLKPKYGLDGEAGFEENVWGGPSQPPRENP
jgi:hypothetical protein